MFSRWPNKPLAQGNRRNPDLLCWSSGRWAMTPIANHRSTTYPQSPTAVNPPNCRRKQIKGLARSTRVALSLSPLWWQEYWWMADYNQYAGSYTQGSHHHRYQRRWRDDCTQLHMTTEIKTVCPTKLGLVLSEDYTRPHVGCTNRRRIPWRKIGRPGIPSAGSRYIHRHSTTWTNQNTMFGRLLSGGTLYYNICHDIRDLKLRKFLLFCILVE